MMENINSFASQVKDSDDSSSEDEDINSGSSSSEKAFAQSICDLSDDDSKNEMIQQKIIQNIKNKQES